MNFVNRELVKWAPSNASTRRPELEKREQAARVIEGKLDSMQAAEDAKQLQRSLREKTKGIEELWKEMKKAVLSEVIPIEFNAWRYEDAKQIWAGLASHITKRLEESLPWIKRKWIRLLYAWKNRRYEVVTFLIAIVASVAVGAFIYAIRPSGAETLLQSLLQGKILPESFNVAIVLVPSASALVLLWYIVWRSYRVIRPVSQRILEYGRLPNYREQMGFQNRVLEDVQFIYERVKSRAGWPRVVVFIDDLDRCSEEKIMDTLQAINLILAASKFYVLLGIDTEMLYRAIRNYYTKNKLDQSLPEDFPEDYLRKIIQLPFHLPESPSAVRFLLLKNFFSQEAQRIFAVKQATALAADGDSGPPEEEMEEIDQLRYDGRNVSEPGWKPTEPVEDTADELAAFDEFKEFLKDNPRELKRLVNVHRLVKILLQRRDVAWSVGTQRKLVKWLVFCARWPGLIDDALRFARDNPKARDCLAAMMGSIQHSEKSKIEEFVRHSVNDDVLTAADLQPGGRLELAANFSNLVKEQAQSPLQAATDKEKKKAQPRARSKQKQATAT